MKIIYTFFWTLLIFPSILSAQESGNIPSDIFLFDQFTPGKILLTDKRSVETLFNYNCGKQELYYKDGNGYQMMYNTSNVDTLWIGNRMFVPAHQGSRFLECISAGDDTLLVDWKVKLYYKGKQGAMGVVSQAGGQSSVDVELMLNRGIGNPDNRVYKKDFQNTYQTCLEGRQVSFRNLKSFLKLFPEAHRKTIRQLVKDQSVNFDDPWQVAKLIALCKAL